MTSEKIKVAGIVDDSITDGPGLRFVIFTQGCIRNCRGCHNPSAASLDGGVAYTPEELFSLIQKNPILSGVTLSGGEPLLQSAALLPLAQMIKDAGLSLVIYSGAVFEEIIVENDAAVMALLRCADVLIDGPFLEEKRVLSLPFIGSSNQRIIDLPESLNKRSAIIKQDEGWSLISCETVITP
jgi:anaerobic ribonucleoside-triphosphate reductase activating protein